ncbi:MAG: S53 family peptidase [Actinoallomurus sp.]
MSAKRTSLLIAAPLAALACTAAATAVVTTTSNTTTAAPAAASSPIRSAADAGVLSLAGARTQKRAGAHVTTKAAGESIDHPLLPSVCIVRYKTPCYGPEQLRHLYGVDKLGPRAGAGRTVALIMPGVDPVLTPDLEVYSKETGLPAPKLTQIKVGHPAELDRADYVQAITGEELELDAEMIHTMAPSARIVVVATERDDANVFDNFAGTIGNIAKLSGHHVDAVSLSYGWFEPNYDEAHPGKGAQVIRSQAAGLATAARNHMTVLSANGDTGATGPNLAGDALYPHQAAAFIASSPLVTAVAGTELHADDHGDRTTPDTVWGEHDGDGFATGGALSQVFGRPGYQDGIRDIVGGRRGNTDVSMDGSTGSRVWMYTSRYQVLSGQEPGWVRTAGTSAASPLMAGIVADAAQVAGHSLGPINAALYGLGRTPASRAAAGIADVIKGCNTTVAVQGYCARTGTDLPSGIGTIGDASRFVHALAAAASH